MTKLKQCARFFLSSLFTLAVATVGELRSEEIAAQHVIGNTRANWDLTVTTDHPNGVYQIGDSLTLTVCSPRRCHLHILNITPQGDIKVLWPIDATSGNIVEPQQKVVFPDPELRPRVKFTAREPAGKELIVCLATTAPINLKNPDDAQRFAEFLEGVAKVAPTPLARLRSFVTTVETQPDGWAARAVEIQTTCAAPNGKN